MMRNSSLLILEIIWWATGTLSLAAAVRFATTEGGSRTLLFLLMSVISFLFAWVRNRQRKKS